MWAARGEAQAPEIFLQKQVEQVIRRSDAAKSPGGHARMAIV